MRGRNGKTFHQVTSSLSAVNIQYPREQETECDP